MEHLVGEDSQQNLSMLEVEVTTVESLGCVVSGSSETAAGDGPSGAAGGLEGSRISNWTTAIRQRGSHDRVAALGSPQN